MRTQIDDQGQVVRSEGFQWAVLASLVCLLASVFAGQSARRAAGPIAAAMALLPSTLKRRRNNAGTPLKSTLPRGSSIGAGLRSHRSQSLPDSSPGAMALQDSMRKFVT